MCGEEEGVCVVLELSEGVLGGREDVEYIVEDGGSVFFEVEGWICFP